MVDLQINDVVVILCRAENKTVTMHYIIYMYVCLRLSFAHRIFLHVLKYRASFMN